jgi:PAS domain S-box-containing protein
MDFNRTEQILNSGTFELHLDNKTLVCSSGFLNLLGINSASSVSKWNDVIRFIHRDHIKHFKFLIEKLKENHENFSEKLSWKTKEGEVISLITIGEYVEKDQGDQLFFVVQKQRSLDIDLKKKKLLQTVIERAKDGVLITEAEPSSAEGRKVVYVNPAFTQLTGYTADDIIGKTPKILQGPRTDPKTIEEMSTALNAWKPCEVSLINYRKNGEEFWMKLSMTPVADENGWFTHWVAIERDATQSVYRDLNNQLLAEISNIFGQSDHCKDALQQMTEKILEFGNFSIAEVWVPNQETKIFT